MSAARPILTIRPWVMTRDEGEPLTGWAMVQVGLQFSEWEDFPDEPEDSVADSGEQSAE